MLIINRSEINILDMLDKWFKGIEGEKKIKAKIYLNKQM